MVAHRLPRGHRVRSSSWSKFAGSLPAGSDHVVYVQVVSVTEPSVLNEYLPDGQRAIVYLEAAAEPSDDFPIIDNEAGHPEGQPLYQPLSPQGITLQDGDDAVQLLEGARFEGASIDDFVPDAERFPRSTSAGEPDVPAN